MSASVVLLAAPGRSTDIVANALRKEFGEVVAVLENPVGRLVLLRRRARRLGMSTAVGQALFMLMVVPLLELRSRRRLLQLRDEYDLADSAFDGRVVRVPSVNSPEAREVLRVLDPTVIVVNGTRIISTETLSCVDAPFVNVHAGITPQYRGVHGGYWALVDRRPDLFGSTVHLVDTGIDTGPVLAQPVIQQTGRDCFVTYPLLQQAAGLPHLLRAVSEILGGKVVTPVRALDTSSPSRLRSHPTLVSYLMHRVRDGIR